MDMEAADLARWTRFAAKGGIGKCTAICDCVAESAEDLMFLTDDEITVLMQLPEPANMFLGYCEGVVGRFHGKDVQFHSRLKKPIMTKRSSISSQQQQHAKSPTPSSPMSQSVSPAPPVTVPRRTRVSLDEQVSAAIRPLISPAPSPPADPVPVLGAAILRLGKARSDPKELMVSQGEPEFNVSSSSSSSSTSQQRSLSPPKPALISHASSASTSTTSTFVSDSTATNDNINNTNPIIAIPDHPRFSTTSSARHASLVSTYSQESHIADNKTDPLPMDPPAPAPPSILAQQPPAPIIVPSPSSTPPPLPPPAPASTSTSTIPTSQEPDTSISTFFDASTAERISLALSEDGEVGIGLSLLQNMADGASFDGWSDSDSEEGEEDGERVRRWRGEGSDDGEGRERGRERESVVSEDSQYSGSEAGGLGYEDTETGHGSFTEDTRQQEQQEQSQLSLDDTLEADITQTQEAFTSTLYDDDGVVIDSTGAPSQQLGLSFPPVAPLSPSLGGGAGGAAAASKPKAGGGAQRGFGYEYRFPAPPTHTHRVSLRSSVSQSRPGSVNGLLQNQLQHPSSSTQNPPPSQDNPNQTENQDRTETPPDHSEHELSHHLPAAPTTPPLLQNNNNRRPSLAPSAASTATSASDWEGAADIYDNYRYSRFSVSSRRGSLASSRAGGVGSMGVIPPFVDNPEARERADSMMGGRPSGEQYQSRQKLSGEQQQHQHQQQVVESGRVGVGVDVDGGVVARPARSRSNTTASLGPRPVGHANTETTTTAVGEGDGDDTGGRGVHKSAMVHKKVDSEGSDKSDGSVYTQSSAGGKGSVRGSRGGVGVAAAAVSDTLPVAEGNSGPILAKSPPSNSIPAALMPGSSSSPSLVGGGGSGNRPAPLNLFGSTYRSASGGDMNGNALSSPPVVGRSPLLHTTWGSPLASPAPGDAFFGAGADRERRVEAGSRTGFTGTGEGFTGRGKGNVTPASATHFSGVGEALSKLAAGGDGAEEIVAAAAPPPSSPLLPPSSTGGVASALRQRLEVEKKASVDQGRKIVVEDDEDIDDEKVVVAKSEEGELRGEYLGSAPGSPGEGNTSAVRYESPEQESELEIAGRGRPAPLLLASRQSSSGTEDRDILVEPPSPMVPSMPEVPPSPTTSNIPQSLPASLMPGSHLRPSLTELRGGQPGQPNQGQQRRSLFLPHPNAPKPPSANSPGPMYITQQQPPPPPQHPVRGGAMQAIRMVLDGQGGKVPGKGSTIYGIMQGDLAASMGPVPIVFSVDPPPARPPPGLGQNGPVPVPVPTPPPPPPSAHAVEVSSPPSNLLSRRETTGNSVVSTPEKGDRPGFVDQRGTGGVIPRANFFPTVGGVRPRSRSFSGFRSEDPEVPLPVQRSREEGSQPADVLSANEIKRSLSPLGSSSPTTIPPLSSSPTNKPTLKPSPLRISSSPSGSQRTNTIVGLRPSKPLSSPLAQMTFGEQQPSSLPPSPTRAGGNRPLRQLRHIASAAALSESPARPIPRTRTTLASGSISDLEYRGPQEAPPFIPSRTGPPVDADAISVRSTRSNVASPPPTTVGRQNSLRSKLSLPNLRRTRSRQDETASITSEPHGPDHDTMQVQDMDFELVRPNLAQFQAARASEDSGVMGRDGSLDVRQDTNILRSNSPALSLSGPRSPTFAPDASNGSSMWQPMMPPPNAPSRPPESESSMEAHRQREQKWMSVMSSVLPSQSRKSKKVKKLLFDGVPSSVRYLVWSHLTDGKARSVPGVYSQLGSRGRVPALADIERDVQRCFTDNPQLQSSQGPVLSLLQAYFQMVPDIQYTTGLTLITGHLLLIAPEEDAFWIFVSIMDTHLRAYFSSTTTQIDIDASLFSRAAESIDAGVAKKLFVDMAISPSTICRPWFTSLFVGCLPTPYLNRVWDIFLFEGITFLFRVGLALISSCRRQILECTSEESVLRILAQPSLSLLPTSPDTLISIALGVKLKDDDIRKQRIKMEAQAKRQTQVPRLVSTPGAISLPRT